MGELLDICRTVTGSSAELVWTPPERIAQAAITPWTELPIWVPTDGALAGLHAGDVSSAFRCGLECRPVADTVADTWVWLETEGDPQSLSDGSVGLDPGREGKVLTGQC